ncbi:MAG: hypothetical protein ACKVRO_04630 [Micropepsaceae bacterium]
MSDSAITAFNTLQPAIVRTIREAFDDAVKEIETRRGALPECERIKVAKHLVDMAKHGECSFERLRGAALNAVPL